MRRPLQRHAPLKRLTRRPQTAIATSESKQRTTTVWVRRKVFVREAPLELQRKHKEDPAPTYDGAAELNSLFKWGMPMSERTTWVGTLDLVKRKCLPLCPKCRRAQGNGLSE